MGSNSKTAQANCASEGKESTPPTWKRALPARDHLPWDSTAASHTWGCKLSCSCSSTSCVGWEGWEQLHNGQESSREKSWEAPSQNRDPAACHPPFQSFQPHQKLSGKVRHQLCCAAPAPSVTRQSHCFRSKQKNTLKPQKLGFFEVIISLLRL